MAVRVKARDPRLGGLISIDRVILTFSQGVPMPKQVCIGLNVRAVMAFYEPLQCFSVATCSGTFRRTARRQRSFVGAAPKKATLPKTALSPSDVLTAPDPTQPNGEPALPVCASWSIGGGRLTLSAAPRDAPRAPAIPLVTTNPSLPHHAGFRSGRLYASVVRDGIRESPRPQMTISAQAPPYPQRRLPAPDMALICDVDSITRSISERVTQSVLAKLPGLIEACVTKVLKEVVPVIISTVVSAMSGTNTRKHR